MVFVSGQSVWIDVFSVWYCVLAVSRAYENVALNKPAFQLHPYIKENKTFDASNAVDGLKFDLSWTGGQCAVSALTKQIAIWWVNLGSLHSIHHITLYFRTDNAIWDDKNNVTSTFLGFSLYVSNTTDRLQGKLCFKDHYFNRSTIPAVFSTVCPVQGQYVIYYNERLKGVSYPSDYNTHAENDLCEVEVYGCRAKIPHCLELDTVECACLSCKPSYHGNLCKPVLSDGKGISWTPALIGGLCVSVFIICVIISCIVLTRISIRRDNSRQQQINEIKPAYNDTFYATDDTVTGMEYTELGEVHHSEQSSINKDTRLRTSWDRSVYHNRTK